MHAITFCFARMFCRPNYDQSCHKGTAYFLNRFAHKKIMEHRLKLEKESSPTHSGRFQFFFKFYPRPWPNLKVLLVYNIDFSYYILMEPITIPKYIVPDFAKWIDFSYFDNVPILMIVFIVFSIIYFIVSCVLFYHWSRYGMKSSGVIIAEILYISVSLALFLFASLALSSY